MNRLKALRTAKGFTQQKTTTLTGIDQSNYSKMERGLIQPTYEQYIYNFILLILISISPLNLQGNGPVT